MALLNSTPLTGGRGIGEVGGVDSSAGMPFMETGAPAEADVSDLTERVETLTNVVGGLRVTVQDRPQKYNVEIRDLDDPSYELTEAMLVLVEEYPADDVVIASVPELEVFGEGVSLSHALTDLKGSILDLYDDLVESDSNELDVVPMNWLDTMKRMIVQR